LLRLELPDGSLTAVLWSYALAIDRGERVPAVAFSSRLAQPVFIAAKASAVLDLPLPPARVGRIMDSVVDLIAGVAVAGIGVRPEAEAGAAAAEGGQGLGIGRLGDEIAPLVRLVCEVEEHLGPAQAVIAIVELVLQRPALAIRVRSMPPAAPIARPCHGPTLLRLSGESV
jgi:hypothetical protein